MTKFYPKLYRTQVKVGLFTVIIVLVLLAGYLWLSNRLSIRSQNDLRLSFEDVMGLEIGDKTMFRGMEVGRIKSIEARDTDILVTARINRDIKLREGARFYISDSSLMGGTALNIAQGGASAALDLHRIQSGEAPTGVMSLLSKANTSIGEFNLILAELRREDGLIQKSSALLDNADSAARSVDLLSSDAKIKLTQSLARIDLLTERISSIVNTNEASVNSLLQSSPAAVANLNSTLDSLQTLSNTLSRTITGVNSGKGTAGRLLNDPDLYDKLVRSVANLDSLVQDIQVHPKKYVKFSLF